MSEVTFQFTKDYKKFKAGQYLQIPKHRFTGQLIGIFEEVDSLVEKKILREIKSNQE